MPLTEHIPQNRLVPVVDNRELVPGIFRLALEADIAAKNVQPGQFLMLGFPQLQDPLLPRPFAIFGIENNRLEVLYKVVGKGTAILSRIRSGELLRIFGPLGNGFSIPEFKKPPLVIAGGIGIASVHLLLEELLARNVSPTLVYGCRTQADLIDLDILRDNRITLHLATDDGSIGFKGSVQDLLVAESDKSGGPAKQFRLAYICGPMAMLKSLAGFVKQAGLEAQYSLEARMACGYGVCQGCTVPTNSNVAGEAQGYQKVCAHGPVFSGDDIRWEDIEI